MPEPRASRQGHDLRGRLRDFVNDPDEVLAAFRVYHTTAELAGVSDPEQIYTLRANLDGLGF
ncbi:hypothetical protein [Thauera sp. AutoDN2]|uniref:hypothetical protein n=1 Tax=Thauera sp. AutoDN2 TaxID=3416051 RepID=UPI002A3877AA|nr:hypothetical protein [Thauera sp.]